MALALVSSLPSTLLTALHCTQTTRGCAACLAFPVGLLRFSCQMDLLELLVTSSTLSRSLATTS